MTLIERAPENEAVGDDVYRRIRADIVFGRLRPGLSVIATVDLRDPASD